MWVVLPVQDESSVALAAVTAVLQAWPEGVDAELLVPVSGPAAEVLGSVLGDAALVTEGTFGELVQRATRTLPPEDRVVVIDEQRPTGPLHEFAVGRLQDHPVLHHALDHRAFLALATVEHTPSAKPLPITGAELRQGLLSAVVVTRGSAASLRACLEHLRRGAPAQLEIVVVNLGGSVEVSAWLAARRDLVVVRGAGSRDDARNAGLARCTGEQVLMIDSDTVLPRHWARCLALKEDCVAVGPVAHGLPSRQHDHQALYDDLAAFQAVAAARRADHHDQTVVTSELAVTPLLARTTDLRTVGGYGPGLSTRLRDRGSLTIAGGVLAHVEVGPTVGSWPDDGVAPLLSAALIVKDEQAALPACLASLRGVVDEVVVCDTGSRDATVEIARAMGARVVTADWDDDFSAARNVALDAARGTWVLSIDADEQVHVEDVGALRHALALCSDDALRIPITSRTRRNDTIGYEHHAARLLRRNAVEWVGAVHEVPVHKGSAHWLQTPPLQGIRLVHDGYVEEVRAGRGKRARNLTLAEKDLARTVADDPRRWKVLYELARTLGVSGETALRVLDLTTECLALDPPAHFRDGAQVLRSGALLALCRFAEAEASARATGARDASGALALAAVLELTGRAEEAGEVLRACSRDGTDPVKERLVDQTLARLGPLPGRVVMSPSSG